MRDCEISGNNTRSVAIAGCGAICSVGKNTSELLVALKNNTSGLRASERFSNPRFQSNIVGAAPIDSSTDNPAHALASSALHEAIVGQASRLSSTLLLGIALVLGGERYNNVRKLLQEGLELTMQIVGWVMRLAPFGIAALLIKLVATQDVAMLGTLAKFVAVVAGTTLLHGVVILPLLLYVITGKTPLWFWRGARESLVTAFATSSRSEERRVGKECCR